MSGCVWQTLSTYSNINIQHFSWMRSFHLLQFKQNQTKLPFLLFFVRLCCRDDLLSMLEFMLVCRALFRNNKGHVYNVPDEQVKQIFNVFDDNHDGFIDRIEFQFCWNHWIRTVILIWLSMVWYYVFISCLHFWWLKPTAVQIISEAIPIEIDHNFFFIVFKTDCTSNKCYFGGWCSKWFHHWFTKHQ